MRLGGFVKVAILVAALLPRPAAADRQGEYAEQPKAPAQGMVGSNSPKQGPFGGLDPTALEESGHNRRLGGGWLMGVGGAAIGGAAVLAILDALPNFGCFADGPCPEPSHALTYTAIGIGVAGVAAIAGGAYLVSDGNRRLEAARSRRASVVLMPTAVTDGATLGAGVGLQTSYTSKVAISTSICFCRATHFPIPSWISVRASSFTSARAKPTSS